MSNRTRRAALQFLLCCAGSILVGLACFGPRILDSRQLYFQCVAWGVVASLFVAAWHLARPRWIALFGVLACFGVVAQTHAETPVRLTRDAIGVLAVAGAVRLSLLSDRALPSLKLGKCVLWGAAFAIVQTLALLLMMLIAGRSTIAGPGIFRTTAQVAAVIGVGVGLGSELADLIWTRRSDRGETPRMVGR